MKHWQGKREHYKIMLENNVLQHIGTDPAGLGLEPGTKDSETRPKRKKEGLKKEMKKEIKKDCKKVEIKTLNIDH